MEKKEAEEETDFCQQTLLQFSVHHTLKPPLVKILSKYHEVLFQTLGSVKHWNHLPLQFGFRASLMIPAQGDLT